MWVQIELPKVSEVSQIILDAGRSTGDYPRGYEVVSSLDGKTWSKPLAKGDGKNAVTKIKFPATKAKFFRITQTKKQTGLFWSIDELQLTGKELASK